MTTAAFKGRALGPEFVNVNRLVEAFRQDEISQKAKLSGRFKNFFAFDTETTGLDIRSVDRPFLITACDGVHKWTWRFKVRLRTGRVVPNADEIRDFEETAAQYDWFVGFNTNFDVHAISHFSDFFADKLDRCLDVQIMSWVLDNRMDKIARKGSSGLKYQAYKVCRIPIDDQKALHAATVAARSFAKKHGIDFPRTRSVGECYWLPRALYEKFPDVAPPSWETVDEEYGEIDAVRTAALFVKYCERLDKKGWWRPFVDRQNIAKPFYKIERRGLRVIPQKLDALVEDAAERARRSRNVCEKIVKQYIPKEEFNFNINSKQDVALVLYDVLQFPVFYRTGKTRSPATHERAISACLEFCSVPDPKFEGDPKDAPLVPLKGFKTQFNFLRAYQEYQKWTGAQSKANSYVKKLFDNHLFPSYNLGSTATTRLSSENPNGQNIKKPDEDEVTKVQDASLRGIFGPPKDEVWWSIDLNQNQLRIYACLANETKMLDAFDRGEDIHSYVALSSFGEVTPKTRFRAKAINFGIIFGSGKASTDARAGEGSYERYLETFPSLASFMRSCSREAEETGGITLPNGLFLAVESGKSYVGANYKVQGIEGLQVGDAVRDIDDYFESLKGNAYLLSCVHDDITFAIKKTVKPTIQLGIVTRVAEMFRDAGEKYGIVAGVKIERTTKSLDDAEKVKIAGDRFLF